MIRTVAPPEPRVRARRQTAYRWIAAMVFAVVILGGAWVWSVDPPGDRPIVFGDSLTVDAADALHRMPGDVFTWAANGWSAFHFEKRIAEAGRQQRAVVLALGTADRIWSGVSVGAWRRALDELEASGSCVVFIRPHRSESMSDRQIAFLDHLDREVGSRDNTHIVNWDAVARAMIDHHTDGVHHDDVLQQWYAFTLWLAAHHTC